MLSLLAGAFVDFLKNEWLGLLASAFILVSFLTTNQTKTRLINMVGCVIFVVYGFILPAYSTAFMNGALFIVHVVYLTKDFLKARKQKSEQPQVAEEATQEGEPTSAETSDKE